jgi:hypothetical protein
MSVRAIFVAMALALLGTSASAQVPDPYARQLAHHLSRIDAVVAGQTYQRAAGPFPGGLPQGQRQLFTITLRAGQDYRIVGVCDTRCADLDLRARDPNGAVLDEDVLADAVPVLSLRPELTGQHAIEVDMAQCAAPRCWFAFNVYSRCGLRQTSVIQASFGICRARIMPRLA